jgi:diguanylate cyclase (GGDEF)-like protein
MGAEHPSRALTRPRVVHRQRLERAGLASAALATALFALSLPGGLPLPESVRDLGLYNIGFLGAALAAAARAARDRAGRAAWTALALGLLASAAANFYYSLVLAGLDEPPYPSWADAGLLLIYPLAYVTLVGLLRSRMPHWHPSLWLDGLVVALGAGAVEAAFVLSPVLTITGSRPAAVVTNLCYPLGDLLLMSTVLAGVWLLGRRLDLTWALLGVGVIAFSVGDSIYLVQDSAGLYAEGTALDLTWLIGNVLMAGAAVAGVRPQRVPVEPAQGSDRRVLGMSAAAASRWALLAVPTVVTLACLGVLVPIGVWQSPPTAQWLAAAALCAVAVRSLLTYREVSELAEARRLASTDELTGLLNRRGFGAVTEGLLATDHGEHGPGPGAREPTEGPSALLLLDLDRFKEVNDSLGHHAGDQLLAAVAERLAQTCRFPRDLLARLGGDEFAILLPDTDTLGAVHVAERIRAALSAPFVLEGVRVQSAVSIGIALAPQHGRTLSLLMRRADIAMYRAKGTRTGHAVYDPSLKDPDGEDRLHRLEDLRAAIDHDQLVLHYQPKIDLADGAVCGVEALVRWEHPTRGLLYPDTFLPLAEDAGLMPGLTALVLDRALAQMAAWHRAGRDLTVAVNLPSAAVVDTDLPARIADLLLRHQVPAHALKLEITEESLLDDRVRAREVLAQLRRSGVQIAIDDYGSGYSSLAYLRELPVDELKLDRSFVLPMADDTRAAAIVRSTVELAHSLGLRIVAEGVEHVAAATELARVGCDTAQGFLYSRALPAAELIRWIDRRASEPTDAIPVG